MAGRCLGPSADVRRLRDRLLTHSATDGADLPACVGTVHQKRGGYVGHTHSTLERRRMVGCDAEQSNSVVLMMR
jgi:hypothetical protein